MPEYARTFIEAKNAMPTLEDMNKIVDGQIASENSISSKAKGCLFIDTDPLASIIWSQKLFKSCNQDLLKKCKGRKYDLTILLTEVSS